MESLTTSEQTQMDALAYRSRMLSWSPVGKLIFVFVILVINIITSSMVVPFITLIIGIILMAYSTNFKIPLIIAIALGETFFVLLFGCGMISISGTSGEVLWDTHIIWIHVHMTIDSFNKAWLVLIRGMSGITMMI